MPGSRLRASGPCVLSGQVEGCAAAARDLARDLWRAPWSCPCRLLLRLVPGLNSSQTSSRVTMKSGGREGSEVAGEGGRPGYSQTPGPTPRGTACLPVRRLGTSVPCNHQFFSRTRHSHVTPILCVSCQSSFPVTSNLGGPLPQGAGQALVSEPRPSYRIGARSRSLG